MRYYAKENVVILDNDCCDGKTGEVIESPILEFRALNDAGKRFIFRALQLHNQELELRELEQQQKREAERRRIAKREAS